jgi:hypothetical protein
MTHSHDTPPTHFLDRTLPRWMKWPLFPFFFAAVVGVIILWCVAFAFHAAADACDRIIEAAMEAI